jgi:hypothetical protein
MLGGVGFGKFRNACDFDGHVVRFVSFDEVGGHEITHKAPILLLI